MNFQGLGVLSLLTGGQGLTNTAQSVPSVFSGKAGLEGFSEALQGQITLLQQQADLARVLPDGDVSAGPGDLQNLFGPFEQMSGGQGFAALAGEGLPGVKKMDQDIDLEKTLLTLRDVLQFAAAAAAKIMAADGDQSQQPIDPALENLQEDLKEVDRQLSAVLAPVMDAENSDAQQAIVAAVTSGLLPGGSEINKKIVPHQENFLQQAGKSLRQPAQIQTDAKVQDNAEFSSALLSGKEHGDTEILTEKDSTMMMNEPVGQDRRLATASPGDQVQDSATGKIPDIARSDRQAANNVKAEVPEMTRQINHPRWQQDFAERIVWMQSKSMSAAEIRLNPQHLGPVSVRIDMNQDQQTAITFSASNAAVRDAIDAAIPRLREMFSAQQLHLVQADVTQQSFSEQRQSQDFSQAHQERNSAGNSGTGPDGSDRDRAVGLSEEIKMSRGIAGQGLLNVRV